MFLTGVQMRDMDMASTQSLSLRTSGHLQCKRDLSSLLQVCFHGHMVGSMQYYKPHRPQGPEGEEPLVHLDASGLGVDSGLMVLLAWLCAMCQAQVQGVQLRATTVKVLFGERLKIVISRNTQT